MATDRTLIEPCWKASYGCYAREPVGRICPSDTQVLHLLATAPEVGGRRCLAGNLAALLLHPGRAQATGLQRSLCRRHLRRGQKRGPAWAKPSGGKAQSAWWWSPAKVFLCESIWPQRPRRE